MSRLLLAALALVAASPLEARPVPVAVAADPAPDARYPARMVAFQLPSEGAKINAVLYLASGKGPHPALLLLHGLPGNEQNLDLAQAARRAGWHVLTLHYRGSWGSEGTYSFAHCAQDAANAARFLQDPAHAALYGIDPKRVVVAGHSLGGMMAARTMADVPGLKGAFLIDPADFAAIGRSIATPQGLAAFKAGELDGDMPPLNAREEDLLDELRHAEPFFDLHAVVGRIADRPLGLIYAQRGLGSDYADKLAAAKGRGGRLTAANWPTDHSFSDHRIALTAKLLDWLAALR